VTTSITEFTTRYHGDGPLPKSNEMRAQFWRDSSKIQRFSSSSSESDEIGNGNSWEGDDGKKYHGVRYDDTITKTGKSKPSQWKTYNFFVYPREKQLITPDKWDTHSSSEFCTNCSKIKNRKNYDIYKCLGH